MKNEWIKKFEKEKKAIQNKKPEKLFRQAIDNVNSRYDLKDYLGVVEWAKNNNSTLLDEINSAEEKFINEHTQEAVKSFEKAVDKLIKNYNKKELRIDEAIEVFNPLEIWKLSKEKAAVLDKVFSVSDDIKVGGLLWQSPGKENLNENIFLEVN